MNEKSVTKVITTRKMEQLPYRRGSDAWKKRYKKATEKGDLPVEVNCIPAKKYEILPPRIIIRALNEKTGHWEEWIGVEYLDLCPVCGTLMKVRAVKGTTWFACCSNECYEKFEQIEV